MSGEASQERHENEGTRQPEEARRVASFVLSHPIFDELEPEVRRRLVATVVERHVAAGEFVLVEKGPPSTHLYLIREGMVELVLGGLVVDIVSSGEVFGAPSLLTGRESEFTARAREDTTLYLIPRDIALGVLSRPAVVASVVGLLQERLARTARNVVSLSEARRAAVSPLVRGPAVFCAPETSIRETARLMSHRAVTAILVHTREDLGIVTDADLRDKAVAAGLSADAPVSTILTVPVRSIGQDRVTQEASIEEMMEAGVNHLAVVDTDGRVTGVVSAGSLMVPDALSPFALRWSISAARDLGELVQAAERLPRVFLSLIDAHIEPPSVARIISLENDALTRRLLALTFASLGPPPVPYAWLALGSAGRSELTLLSDQDNALAYADTADPSADAYFAAVGSAVNDGLARCGFPPDASGVLARDEHWRMSLSRWMDVFRGCYEVWDAAHTARACVAFDFRQVAGELDVVGPLVDVVLEAREHPSLLNRLARTVTGISSPLGFRGRLGNLVDVKRSALLPIENIARYYALAQGISMPGTLDRIGAVEVLEAVGNEAVSGSQDAMDIDAGSLDRQKDREMMGALRDAFTAMMALRLHHHAEALRSGQRPSDTIETPALGPLARAELQEALRLIAVAQRRVPSYVMS
jgi:CBS domain-containing protein